jgi:hypothetical protein
VTVKDDTIIKAILALIDAGWGVYLFVCSLLVLGPIAFIAALIGLNTNPIGIAVTVAVAAVGGIAAIRKLYREKKLPLEIKETGKRFKPDFKSLSASGNRPGIDKLELHAADHLIDLATETK